VYTPILLASASVMFDAGPVGSGPARWGPAGAAIADGPCGPGSGRGARHSMRSSGIGGGPPWVWS
jgi:hypothetical protein